MEVFDLADELGPCKVIHIQEPTVGLRAIAVVDNVAIGPAIGGVRMATDVSLTECARLARAMTLKNAAAGLRHGGGKSVIMGDPRMAPADKEKLVRCLGAALRNVTEYIVGPDMGTDERCMAWIWDECGRAVGLPRALGGIPLDEIGATGWGLLHAAQAAEAVLGLRLSGARVAVQGFGAVGLHVARFLSAHGAVVVSVSDSRMTVHRPDGLDVEALAALKRGGQALDALPGVSAMPRDAIVDIECELWIPAARPDVIDERNVQRLNTKLVLQGANIPVTHAAERLLHARGVWCVPDFIANAGGVICAAMEYAGATEQTAMQVIGEKVRHNTEQVLQRARAGAMLPRAAANELALERVRQAMALRRWSGFSNAPGFV